MSASLHLPQVPQLEFREAPESFECGDVSVIIPVKDDTDPLLRLLRSLRQTQAAPAREVIVVDNNSAAPLRAVPEVRDGLSALPSARVIECARPGPAAARNAGARVASGTWLLFLDADCVATPTTIAGYRDAMNGSIAYAGDVKAAGASLLDRYYEAQQTLMPPPMDDRPAYLVTANALVWKPVFENLLGFDEAFPIPGGEDIDLALRLRAVGRLSYARNSVVHHDFSDGPLGFYRRFHRYGRGNYLVERKHSTLMAPIPFRPEVNAASHYALAALQFVAMSHGYYSERWRSRRPPPHLPARVSRVAASTRGGVQRKRVIG